MVARETGYITIYDRKNKNKPLVCHKIDAREFLAHKSKRWSTSPDKHKVSFSDKEGKEVDSDDGEAMRLKAMELKPLRALAWKEGVEDVEDMSRAKLVEALLLKAK